MFGPPNELPSMVEQSRSIREWLEEFIWPKERSQAMQAQEVLSPGGTEMGLHKPCSSLHPQLSHFPRYVTHVPNIPDRVTVTSVPNAT